MGAEFQTYRIVATSKADVKAKYESLRKQAQYDHGHAGYTGTLAEDSGLDIREESFATADEAEDWISDNCWKWEDTLAVRVGPANNGVQTWLLGGLYSS